MDGATQRAVRELEDDGRYWARKALSPDHLAELGRVFPSAGLPGRRFRIPALESIAPSACHALFAVAERLLPDCRPVRAVVFEKTAESNWRLPWHQDRVIAVRARVEAPGFDHWTMKDGQAHCEPPTGVLEGMMFARVHLDGADADNGALEVARGSHRAGRIPEPELAAFTAPAACEVCVAEAGDVLFAKALLLHRSGSSARSSPRRALRVDFSAYRLPPPLEWAC